MTLIHKCNHCITCFECMHTFCKMPGIYNEKHITNIEGDYIVTRCPNCNNIVEKFPTLEAIPRIREMEERDIEIFKEEQKEAWKHCDYRMREEGFDYCFRLYSSFDEIKDDTFHELRKNYIESAKKLETYVKSKIKDNEL